MRCAVGLVLLGLLAAASVVVEAKSDPTAVIKELNAAWGKSLGLRGPAAAAVAVKPAWFPTQTCDDSDDPTRNCLLCNRVDTACDACLAGNYLSGKVCRKCKDPLCLFCGPLASPCNRCLGVVKSDPYSYANPGYPVFRNPIGQCKKCTSQEANVGCLQCDRWGRKCTLCDEGYYQAPDGTCSKCLDDNCKHCGSDLKCIECDQLPHIQYDENGDSIGGGYGLAPPSDTDAECKNCASPGCLSCKANFQQCDAGGCQNGLPGAGERGYGRNTAAITPEGQCLPCADPNCANCQEDYRVCTACFTDTDPNPILAGGKCVPCTLPGCSECEIRPGGTIGCKTCRDGYAPDYNKWGVATSCSPLIKCADPNCVDCRGNPASCRKGGCKPMYYNVWNRCAQCLVMMCNDCGPANYCSNCMNGYYSANGICRECLSNRANTNPEYSFCDTCKGWDGSVCTSCWPADEFKPDPANPSKCVRYARVTAEGTVPV